PDSVTTLNQISTAGSFLLGASTLFFLWNIYITSRHGEKVTADEPWGYANSLEWRRPARRRGTTSRRYRGSGPSGPRSTCTTLTSTPAGPPRPFHPARLPHEVSRRLPLTRRSLAACVICGSHPAG